MMTNEYTTIVGVFRDKAQAEQAVDALEKAGLTEQQIGFVRRGEKSPINDASMAPGVNKAVGDTSGKTNIAAGVAGGGVLGGIAGAALALLIPGVGPAVAGGILAATLGGVAIGGAAGGLVGMLTYIGVPEKEAFSYQREFDMGHTIVTVRTTNQQREAMDILHHYGAFNTTTHMGSGQAPNEAV